MYRRGLFFLGAACEFVADAPDEIIGLRFVSIEDVEDIVSEHQEESALGERREEGG
jgi:hypothetical protein